MSAVPNSRHLRDDKAMLVLVARTLFVHFLLMMRAPVLRLYLYDAQFLHAARLRTSSTTTSLRPTLARAHKINRSFLFSSFGYVFYSALLGWHTQKKPNTRGSAELGRYAVHFCVPRLTRNTPVRDVLGTCTLTCTKSIVGIYIHSRLLPRTCFWLESRHMTLSDCGK